MNIRSTLQVSVLKTLCLSNRFHCPIIIARGTYVRLERRARIELDPGARLYLGRNRYMGKPRSRRRPFQIGDHVWIGTGAVIVGASIGGAIYARLDAGSGNRDMRLDCPPSYGVNVAGETTARHRVGRFRMRRRWRAIAATLLTLIVLFCGVTVGPVRPAHHGHARTSKRHCRPRRAREPAWLGTATGTAGPCALPVGLEWLALHPAGGPVRARPRLVYSHLLESQPGEHRGRGGIRRPHGRAVPLDIGRTCHHAGSSVARCSLRPALLHRGRSTQ